MCICKRKKNKNILLTKKVFKCINALSVTGSPTSFLLLLTQCAHGWLVDCDSQLIIAHRDMQPLSSWWSDNCSNVVWYEIRGLGDDVATWASSCLHWRSLLWVIAISEVHDLAFNEFLAIDSISQEGRKFGLYFCVTPLHLCAVAQHTPVQKGFTSQLWLSLCVSQQTFLLLHFLFECDILKLTNIDSCPTSKQLTLV